MKLVQHSRATEAARRGAGTNGTITDLLVFVLALPKPQGLALCREIRRDPSLNRLPIAILTAHGKEVAGVLGLAKGIDDDLKLSDPRESLAHVKSLLGLVQSSEKVDTANKVDAVIEVGELVIDPTSFRVTHAGKPAMLTALEFRLLYYLAAWSNHVFTRTELLAAVYPAGRSAKPRIIDVYIRRLRVKIESDPKHPTHLKTLSGIGYLFDSDADSISINPVMVHGPGQVSVAKFERPSAIPCNSERNEPPST